MNVEYVPWPIIFWIPGYEGIADMSPRALWHFMTWLYKCKEDPLMGKYSLVEHCMVMTYDTFEEQYVVTGNLFCLTLLLFFYI